jgi:hypothetical protein
MPDPEPERKRDVRRGKPAGPPTALHSPEPDRGLAHEVELINTARAQLKAGQGHLALSTLDRYAAEAQQGRLQAEALYLRMESLVQMGDPTAAENAARRLLSAYPKGAHAARARAVLGLYNP